jgi:hypothetical protein
LRSLHRQRFASFAGDIEAVPISKTGKNALDFHLAFYLGRIASQNPQAKIVVVANDKGYDPVLNHAKAKGLAVRRCGHARVPPDATKKAATKKVAAKQAPAKKAATKKAVAATTKSPAGKKTAKSTHPVKTAAPASAATRPEAGDPLPGSPAMLRKMTESLRKMEQQRPRKQASLRRALKPLLGNGVSEASIEMALSRLIEQGVVAVVPSGAVTYPKFAVDTKAGPITS